MIVAVAGHVDHGKTSLVRALTGVDTDRLPEEKRRGMSIEVGFAYADRGQGGRIGFVDVPGHERFVANLLAGLGGVDLGLLVVAADDGPMPQTREHVAILAALGVDRCLVALTKTDRVDAARRAAAEFEVDALLGTGPFAGAPVFATVATTGEGVAALRRALDGIEAPARRRDGAFRLAVDRSFVLDGSGRVVTGAVLSGRVDVGDRVVVSPHGTELRVRGVQAQGRPAAAATAGERCALNLAGAALKDAAPARGDWIVAPTVHAPTDRLDVRLVATASAPRALPAHAGGLLLHLGAAAVGVRVALLAREPLPPGGCGLAQLVLDRPVSALHGDRFVLRDPAAGVCLGGGCVVDPFAGARGRATPGRIARLEALDIAAPDRALLARLAADSDDGGVDLDRFLVARNLGPVDAEALLRRPELRVVSLRGGRRALGAARWQALQAATLEALGRWHAARPDSVGPGEAALAAEPGLHGTGRALLRAALGELAGAGEVVAEGFRWRLAGHRPMLSAADAALLERVAERLAAAGLRPPIVGELATALRLVPAELLEFLERASRLGALVRVAPNRWFLPATVAALAEQARQLAATTAAGFDAAAYRDRTGIGRNLTVQVLEFLDREGVTRFDGRRRSLPA